MSDLVDEIKFIISKETVKDGQGDFWSFGNSKKFITDLIDKEEKKITPKEIRQILHFLASSKDYPDFFMDIILKKFPLQPDFIEKFLAYCLKYASCGEGYEKSANQIINFYLDKLTNNSLVILLEFGKIFQNDVLKSIQAQREKDILNSPTQSGLSIAEIVVLQKKYRMSLEFASLGANFERILLACPGIFTQLRPSFFCHGNHNDIKLRMIMMDASRLTNFNIKDFKPIFDAIQSKQFNDDALTLLAINEEFKQRILDYVGTQTLETQKSLLESFSQKTSPFYVIYNTPRGFWRTPNPSHGFQKKILDKYSEIATKKEVVNDEPLEEKQITLKK